MFSVLLVDDEQLDREGLYHQIPWASLQVDEIRLVRSGREALKLLRQKPADILLTDISMPGMSGLELAEKAVRFCPDLRVIFISGYDDFAYAQKAVTLNASGYLLKPVETEEFSEVFWQTAQAILEERERQSSFQIIKDQAAYGEFLKCSKTLADFLILGRSTPEIVEKIAADLGAGPYGLVLIEIERYDEWINDTASEEAEKTLAVFRKQFDHPIEGFSLMFAQIKPSRYALLYNSEEGVSLQTEALRALIENIKSDCKLTITLSVSNLVRETSQIPTAYRECRRLLLQSVFVGSGTVIEQDVGALREGLPVDYILSQMNEEILKSVRSMEGHHLLSFVEAVFDDMQARQIFPLTIVRNISIQIISRLQFALVEEKLGAAFLDDPLLWEQIINVSSFEGLRQVVMDYFSQVSQQLSKQKEQHYWEIAERIIDYIQKHYGEEITLKTIAAQFYYSPNHLGVLFKEVTGKTFHEYLTQYRMQVAAKLLKEGVLYIYEVASQVSYKSTIAFSNQFRREFGVRPAEYSARYRR